MSCECNNCELSVSRVDVLCVSTSCPTKQGGLAAGLIFRYTKSTVSANHMNQTPSLSTLGHGARRTYFTLYTYNVHQTRLYCAAEAAISLLQPRPLGVSIRGHPSYLGDASSREGL